MAAAAAAAAATANAAPPSININSLAALFTLDPPSSSSPRTTKVVYSRTAIFWRYAKSSLIVDLLAAFPFTFIPGLGPGSAEGNHEIAYLLSLPKMFQVYWLMTMVYENHRLHEGTFLAVRTLLSVVVVS